MVLNKAIRISLFNKYNTFTRWSPRFFNLGYLPLWHYTIDIGMKYADTQE
jgi:hypothetical protein